MRIYLSFSSDKNSTEIYGRLKRSLIGVGYDVTSSLDIFVEPVEFIADVIRREILDSDIMIAIVSEEYSESAMCRTELNIARQNRSALDIWHFFMQILICVIICFLFFL